MEKNYQNKFISDPDNLVEVEEFISRIADELNLDEEIKSNISLSVSEASSNAMVHGNKLDPNKFVTISVTINENKIVIMIEDEGNGFDLDSVPDPTAPENLLKDSGRGIHIMKSFLDDVKYNFTSTGTQVILTASLK